MNLHKSPQRVNFIIACILLGFTSLAAQIIVFREMMVVFYGNELILGILLCVWLFWVGVGSAWGNRMAQRWNFSPEKLSFLYLLLSVSILVSVIFIRFSKQILGAAPAEIVGFLPMLFFSLAALCPLCLALGMAFVLNSKSWSFDETLVFSVNRVYLWESLGAALAGLVVTFVFIPHFSDFTAVYLLLLLNFLFFAVLFTSQWKKKPKGIMLAVLVLAFCGFMISNLGERLDLYTAGKILKNLPLIRSADTMYGKIAIIRQQEQITFYENGLMLFSCPDDFSAEEAVHFALLEHPNPRSLLLIGGGMGGAISQALQYDSLKIDYVEIDPELIHLGKEYLPQSEINSLKDPRVTIHLLDGRLFIKRNLNDGKMRPYDVIILNLPDPSTAQLNRLYTIEFFDMVKSTLNQEGVFSFKAGSAENYISGELGLYLSALYRTLRSVFEEVKVLPGDNAVFLASKKKGMLFDDWKAMITNLKERNLTTRFVNENFLPDRLSSLRFKILNAGLDEGEGKINSDLEPICYFYNGILWSKQFGSLEKNILLHLSKLNRFWFMAAISLLFAIAFFLYSILRSRKSNLALAVIFTTGVTSILVEIILVLSFQTFQGNIYSMIGLIFTLFMLGLFLGAVMIQKMAAGSKIGFKRLVYLQLIQVVFLPVLLMIISFLAEVSLPEWLISVILLLMVSVSGFLGGMLFYSANHVFLNERSTRKAGTGYAVDLFGSAFSSLLASALLIPLLGMSVTLVMLLLVNLVCLFFLFVNLKIL